MPCKDTHHAFSKCPNSSSLPYCGRAVFHNPQVACRVEDHAGNKQMLTRKKNLRFSAIITGAS